MNSLKSCLSKGTKPDMMLIETIINIIHKLPQRSPTIERKMHCWNLNSSIKENVQRFMTHSGSFIRHDQISVFGNLSIYVAGNNSVKDSLSIPYEIDRNLLQYKKFLSPEYSPLVSIIIIESPDRVVQTGKIGGSKVLYNC